MFVRVVGTCYKEYYARATIIFSNREPNIECVLTIMDWEVHHNRRRPEPPAWSQWTPIYPVTYLFQWALYCFVIPFILGMVMTPLGILFITVVIDYFQYIKAIRLEEY